MIMIQRAEPACGRGGRAAALVAITLFSGLLAGCGGPSTPIAGDRALEHVRKILEFGPRPAGSKNLTLVAAYIRQQITETVKLTPISQHFEVTKTFRGKETTTKFQNIFVEIPGSDPQGGPVIVIGAHYDSKLTEGHEDANHNFHFVGAIDAAGASGLLLELARVISQRTGDNRANYMLVWFDGEESMPFHWDTDLSLFGSRHFVKTMAADKERFPAGLNARMHAMVLLDLIGDKVQKIDRDTASSADLTKLFKEVAVTMGEGDRLHRYESSITDDHIPFINYGIPAVNLIDIQYRVPPELNGPALDQRPPEARKYFPWWHTSEDTIDKMSAESLKFVGDLVYLALPKLEEFVAARHRGGR